MTQGLPDSASLRARRWDVLVLGGALPGLIAAARLAMAGHRVLVAEEEAAVQGSELLREPFFLPVGPRDGLVDSALRSLAIPPIARRQSQEDDLSFQVLLPEARLDIASAARTADEWVAWGLAKPEWAAPLALDLLRAARAEESFLMAGELVRKSGLRNLARSRAAATPERGLPEGIRHAGGALAHAFRAELDVLSNLGEEAVPPEAAARLLGSPLEGTPALSDDHPLRKIVKRRLESLHVEFRTLGCAFQLVELGEHPGIARVGPGDVWLGRALLINSPSAPLGSALAGWGFEVPTFLDAPMPALRRVAIHLHGLSEIVPEPLATRAILVAEDGPLAGRGIGLQRFASPRGSRFVELVASALGPNDPARAGEVAAALEAEVRKLLPFSEGRLQAAPLPPQPRWDDENVRPDPTPERAWPVPLEARVGGRRPIYRVPREGVAAFGAEGDLLLGCRLGDLLRDELA